MPKIQTRGIVLTEHGKNPAAVALGRLGGLKGGKARLKTMTPEQRSRSARKAALARWGRKCPLTTKDFQEEELRLLAEVAYAQDQLRVVRIIIRHRLAGEIDLYKIPVLETEAIVNRLLEKYLDTPK